MARSQDRPEDVPRARGVAADVTHAERGPRIAVAHEWLVGYAGSERVVEQILAEFPGAELLTSVIDAAVLPDALKRGRPSALQHVPGAVHHHEWVIPLMPLAWKLRRPVQDVDVLVSSSHACAKAVRVERGIPHLCYCHTPMRYAWHFEMEAARFPTALRPAAWATAQVLRRWDAASAGRVTAFVANSTAVAERIRRSYGRDAEVIFPPVDTGFFCPSDKVERGGTFLYVGRLVSYKRPDIVVEAFRGTPYELAVVGDGHLRRRLEADAPTNVRFLGTVDDERLRDLYRSARALVYAGEEDFGIAMAEALACGTPVIAYAAGGAADIVDDGATGVLFREQTATAARGAVERFVQMDVDHDHVRQRAERFSRARFRRELRAAVDAVASPATRV